MSGLLPLQQQLRSMGPEYSNAASWTSYQLCPRASIFRRNFSDVVDVDSMKHLMRSNDYTTDKVCCLLGNRQAGADIHAAIQAASGHHQLDIIIIFHPQHAGLVAYLQCAAGVNSYQGSTSRSTRQESRAGHRRLKQVHVTCHKAAHDLAGAVQLSWGSPVAAVCARGDLESADAVPSGCFDTKVTSYEMALRMQVDAVAGPTTEVSTLHSPADRAADYAIFNDPAYQLQTDLCMPHGLRHTHICVHAAAILCAIPLCCCLAIGAAMLHGSWQA